MDEQVKAKLEEANKLIFVKQYVEAERLLGNLLKTEAGGQSLLVHLRAIELASKLDKLSDMRQRYQARVTTQQPPWPYDLCLAFVEQQGESVASAESISRFQELIKVYGPHAAMFFGIGLAMESQGNYDRAVYNYEQSIAADPSWYPSYFGLSQIYYQKGDDKQGDHYFYLFEQSAPYNVYGNFETHRKLCEQLLDDGRFADAETAITALGEWWVENRGHCPAEISVYESLATARISEVQGDRRQADQRRAKARSLALQVLQDKDARENVLYFIAKALEDFGFFDLAFQFYKRILRTEGANPAMVQRIGGQFLSMGEHRLAKELFEEAYAVNPDNPEIRFCLLVSHLKLANVNVEEYLVGKERLRQLIGSGGDRVEILALLHSLLAKFSGDAEVHGHMGDIYLRLGNKEKATRHFQRMHELDGASSATALRYASFIMQNGEANEAIAILNRIADAPSFSKEEQSEILWLKASYYARKHDFRESGDLLRRAMAFDPWNVSYVVQEAINLSHLHDPTLVDEPERLDEVLRRLARNDESGLSWEDFDQRTAQLEGLHQYELVYSRRKLRFLYANGSEEALRQLVKAASRFDGTRGTFDFMRLLNTNFDGPHIYWALGVMFKDLWQLEIAGLWLEQALLHPVREAKWQARIYLELADCYIWRGASLPKAIEYGKLALDLGEREDHRGFTVLAHAYLRSGQVRQAQLYLEQAEKEGEPEAIYLKGLIHYRNGDRHKANHVWKPLLTVRSDSLRFHNIKKEILRYYFDGAPYLKAN